VTPGRLTPWDRRQIAGLKRRFSPEDRKGALARTLASLGELPKRWRLQPSTVAVDGLDGRDVRLQSNVAAWEQLKAERAEAAHGSAAGAVLPIRAKGRAAK
jgi:hypothetical protein